MRHNEDLRGEIERLKDLYGEGINGKNIKKLSRGET